MWRTAFLTAILACCQSVLAQTPTGPPKAALQHPPEAIHQNVVTFDLQRVELQWVDKHWQIVAGDMLLKDFGAREAEARQALQTIQELRLNQLGTVGAPRPIMEYWLSDGQPPHGNIAGL